MENLILQSLPKVHISVTLYSNIINVDELKLFKDQAYRDNYRKITKHDEKVMAKV